MPDYVRIIPLGPDDGFPTKRGRSVDAKYFGATDVPHDAYVYWDEPSEIRMSVFNRRSGAVVVNIPHAVLENDERFLHILAHEVFEIVGLKRIFDNSGGRLDVSRFFELTEPLSTAKNLHSEAWEYADSKIEELRGERT